ncbi:hypothetical protein ETB97_011545 [Aspergillus alliaceus]|uniref:Uncharacterized protein n=1 Tax=Petromyces alliaceus TaxID=209559 RepID=A0A8H6E8J9_PETAA|nr:hypothetical protein ETB97_011545 [Aspergillus burnettii]
MQSGVVQFVTGKNRRRFSIHAALAGVFPKEIFQPPINGQINEVVFGRCCEFVYSGDYSVPLLTAYPCGDDGDQTSDSQVLSRGSARRWDPMNHRGNLFHPTTLPDICAFIKEKLDKAPLDEDGEVPNNDPADNYADDSLCALLLYQRIRSLASFTLFKERTGDIVKPLKFVFEENEDVHDIAVAESDNCLAGAIPFQGSSWILILASF